MQRILVLANLTCPCPGLHAFVHEQAGEPPAEVLVVAPALNSRLRHFVSDSDAAVAAAQARVDLAVQGLEAEGLTVTGSVGDARPLTALEDALSQFAADAVVISTFPDEESSWLEAGLIEQATERVAVPVHHFVTEYGLEDRGKEPAGQGAPA